MAVKYKIMSFVPSNGEFIIRYYEDDIDSGYNENIPLPFNESMTGYLAGAELNRYILGYGPQENTDLKEITSRMSSAHIDALVYDPLADMTPEQRKMYEDDLLQGKYNTHLSEMVDRVAQSKDYDDFNSLMGWASSGDETCANEAKIAIAWKKEVYDIWYKHWNAYIDDGVPLPAWEDMMKEFPEIIW